MKTVAKLISADQILCCSCPKGIMSNTRYVQKCVVIPNQKECIIHNTEYRIQNT